MTERPRDLLWDAFTEHFGEPITRSERGRRNRAVRELREAGVTSEQIGITIDYCRRNFTNFTEMAVCGWISKALKEHSSASAFDNVIALAAKERRDR